MWSSGELSQGFSFIPTPPSQTGDLPPVGEISSSSLSKLPVKRSLPSVRSHLLSDDDDDYGFQYTPKEQEVAPDPRPMVLLADPPVQEAGLPAAESNAKKPRSENDRNYRMSQKLKNEELQNKVKELENVVVELKLKKAKQEVYKEQNAGLSAELESTRISAAKMEDNVAKFKIYEDQRKEAIPCLLKLIEEGGRCNIDKEELWAQLSSGNGRQNFEKYWEENKKYNNGLLNLLEMLLFGG